MSSVRFFGGLTTVRATVVVTAAAKSSPAATTLPALTPAPTAALDARLLGRGARPPNVGAIFELRATWSPVLLSACL